MGCILWRASSRVLMLISCWTHSQFLEISALPMCAVMHSDPRLKANSHRTASMERVWKSFPKKQQYLYFQQYYEMPNAKNKNSFAESVVFIPFTLRIGLSSIFITTCTHTTISILKEISICPCGNTLFDFSPLLKEIWILQNNIWITY